MPQGQHIGQHVGLRLHGTGTTPVCVEATTQIVGRVFEVTHAALEGLAMSLGAVAFGAQPATTRKARHRVAQPIGEISGLVHFHR